ncbi:hypothetical protein PENCOP_c013G00849 [Penicillium coprophilum]|uniref:Uncharacterized protein n=1 Tax=Penicillium coprophilum TaxID=36646 RepID=A0A1V6UAI9_9EURO|nr:hypothetical protein PENCOP_c013G00849 [Penicillium coprophilum]
MSQNDIIYHPAGTSETSRTLWSDDGLESKKEKPTKCLTWIVTLLAALVVATNGAWAWAYHQSQQSEVTRLAERPSFGGNIQPSSSYLPTRIVMQPIYQDTEFNEDGDKKERADNLWKGLFPDGNGVLSLNISEARKHSLHDTAKDPLIPENGLYIVAGFHTMHCLV